MEKQAVKSVAIFAVVLMFLSIIPSGALASENGTSANQTNSTDDRGFGRMMPEGMRHGGAGHNGMNGMNFGPAENITEENFTEVQTTILDSITERIAELQSMYTNVSEATTAEELQQVLLAERQANDKGMSPCGNGFPGKMCASCLFEVENVTDDNYTDVQAEIVNFIGNMTEMLNGQLENTTDENMTEMLNEQITELEELSTNVSEASSAAELQEVVLTYVKAQAVESIEKEIEHIEAIVSENENSTDGNVTELNNKITELTALIEEINAAESFDELRELMSSEMKPENCPMQEGRGPMHEGKGPMQQGGCGKMPEFAGFQQNNSTEV
ncbi:MAG: hypothetical protein QG610_1337 [Euryarchaeota archaeon]|nr:hypothetical protein [Euryarchaeota archaeon]